jgi:hypothetical protein
VRQELPLNLDYPKDLLVEYFCLSSNTKCRSSTSLWVSYYTWLQYFTYPVYLYSSTPVHSTSIPYLYSTYSNTMVYKKLYRKLQRIMMKVSLIFAISN